MGRMLQRHLEAMLERVWDVIKHLYLTLLICHCELMEIVIHRLIRSY